MLSTAINRSKRCTSILFSRQRRRSMAAPASTKAATTSNIEAPTLHWPLSFTLHLPKVQPKTLGSYGFSSDQAPPPLWWSHRLYRGPEGKEINIMYSKTKAESEAIAQHFLDEPILGFDMEWPWGIRVKDTLQNKIGLIQIASEDKIGLFHIGLHPGKTSDDIIAPTLKNIIEDSSVGKVGVNILKADFSRLSRFFGLQPRGAIELSHLHRLVKFGPRNPEYVSVKLVNMASQVEEQLGLPLYKGDVRTSNWSRPLSEAQIEYAAGDAYAGFMLYKCMNAKRLAMRPTPPPPIYAERYPEGKASRDDPIILDVGDGTTITTAEFFGVKPVKTRRVLTTCEAPASRTSKDPLDETSQALYDELLRRRVQLAEKANTTPARVISEILLRAIARARPHDTSALLAIKGVGKTQQQKYGDEWLQVISQFTTARASEQPASTAEPLASKEQSSRAARTPDRRLTSRRSSSGSSSSLAFEEPATKLPQLHTGLSFSLANSKLDGDTVLDDNKQDSDSDDSLMSLSFGTPPSRQLNSGTKRKRSQSPTKQHHADSGSHEPHKTPPHIEHSNTSDTLRPRTTPSQEPKRRFSNDPSLSHALSLAKPPMTPSKSMPNLRNNSSRTPSPPPPLERAKSPIPAPTDLSPASRIAKSKLLAFSRLVTRKLQDPRPPSALPIVTPHTLDLIVRARPQTQDELERIPGVDSLILACEKTGMDLLRNVVKFVGGDTK